MKGDDGGVRTWGIGQWSVVSHVRGGEVSAPVQSSPGE